MLSPLWLALALCVFATHAFATHAFAEDQAEEARSPVLDPEHSPIHAEIVAEREYLERMQLRGKPPGSFHNLWAVKVEGGDAAAHEVAAKHGFHNHGQVRFALPRDVPYLFSSP